jgi:hypothetical protein
MSALPAGAAPFPAEARIIDDGYAMTHVLHVQWQGRRAYCRFTLDLCAAPPPGFDPWGRLYEELLKATSLVPLDKPAR